MQDETLTIFRKLKTDYPPYRPEIIALFPEEPYNDTLCMSYMHVGQHGGADYQGVISITENATPEEYSDLKTELESIGYNLKIRRKWIRSKNYNTCI